MRHSRVGTKFRIKLTLLNFWMKLTQNGYFGTKKKENENYHRILYIQINLDSNFQLKQTTLIFGTNLLWLKTKKMNITIEFFRFEKVSAPIFSLN